MTAKHFDWISHHAYRTPDKLAVVDLGTGRQITYRSFNRRIDSLARHLQEAGIVRGDRIAVLALNSTDTLEIQFSCGRIGAIFLPLNNRLALDELEFILQDSTPRVLVSDTDFELMAIELSSRFPDMSLLKMGEGHSYEAATTSGTSLQRSEEVTHDEVCTIMYTSGTTGRPKGAMITFGMNFWNAVNISPIVGASPESVLLVTLPLFHTGGLNCFTNPVFHAGGTVIVMRSFDAAQTLDLLTKRTYGVNLYFCVPSNYLFMSHLPEFEIARFEGLTSGSGGASMPVALIEQYQRKGLEIFQGYGMTETGPFIFCLGREDAALKVGSCGKRVLHTSVKLIGNDGNEVGSKVPGELWVRGPSITPGYWNRPEANKTAFKDGWLNTGDIVQADDDGHYYIVDRSKDMYISGGENVYPAEVENAIFHMERVADVAIIGIPDERWGETGQAFVVVKSGQVLTAADVVAHCRSKLARFKCPAIVTFVDDLPRTATGKVHKPTLRESAHRIKQRAD